MAPGAAILIACRDLLFRSKVETTLRHMGMVPCTLGAAGDPGVAMAQERPAAAIVAETRGGRKSANVLCVFARRCAGRRGRRALRVHGKGEQRIFTPYVVERVSRWGRASVFADQLRDGFRSESRGSLE